MTMKLTPMKLMFSIEDVNGVDDNDYNEDLMKKIMTTVTLMLQCYPKENHSTTLPAAPQATAPSEAVLSRHAQTPGSRRA